MKNEKLFFELYKRLDYDQSLGELRRKHGFTGVVGGALVGSIDTSGSLQATFLGKRRQVAHLIWLMETGTLPSKFVHHINGNKSDNRYSNLKEATRADLGNLTEQAVTARIRNSVKHWKPSLAMPMEERLKRDRERRAENRSKYREIINKSSKKHYANNKHLPGYKASKSCRQLLNRVIQAINVNKTKSTEAELGYSFEEFKNHIESQFTDGMCWSNHGEWHVDHIKPVAAFVSEGVLSPSIINALDNLQPLAARDNQRKGARYQQLPARPPAATGEAARNKWVLPATPTGAGF